MTPVDGVPIGTAPVIDEAGDGLDGLPGPGDTGDGAQAAAAQAVARPPVQAGETAGADDPRCGPEASDGHVLPDTQLVPATVVGLAVDRDTWWDLPPESPEPPDATAIDADDAADRRGHAPGGVPGWHATLARALDAALAGAAPPPALALAAGEWRRGRRVAIACPLGDDPAGPAVAFLVRRDPAGLDGVRLPARLLWRVPAAGPGRWWHARLVKRYAPRRGRELVAADDAPPGELPCALQVGPVALPLRCEVLVRVDDAGTFWDTLDVQWSLRLVVGARPLGSAR